jgi:hypothetical protein
MTRFLTSPLPAVRLHADHGRGCDPAEAARRTRSFGSNLIGVRVPSVARMFVDEVCVAGARRAWR